MTPTLRSVGVSFVTVVFVLAPGFTEPFTGYTRDQLPLAIENPPIQPAGYAFSIWGVIYLWLVGSAVFGLFARREDHLWDRVRMPIIFSIGLGIFWLWIAGQTAIWGTIAIILMLVFALIAFIQSPDGDRWWLAAPLGLYAGWLSAASIVSATITLAGFGILFDWTAWAVVGLILATGLGIVIQARKPKFPEYSLSIIWAAIGVIIANGSGNWAVTGLATACALFLTVNAGRVFTRA